MSVIIRSKPPISTTQVGPESFNGWLKCSKTASIPGVRRDNPNLSKKVEQNARRAGMQPVPGHKSLFYSNEDGSVYGLHKEELVRGVYRRGSIYFISERPLEANYYPEMVLVALNRPRYVAADETCRKSKPSRRAIEVAEVMAAEATKFDSKALLFGSLTAVRIPNLRNISTLDLEFAVQKLGVPANHVGQDQYQFPDGSWILIHEGQVIHGLEDADGVRWRLSGPFENNLQFPMAKKETVNPHTAIGNIVSRGAPISYQTLLADGFHKPLPSAPIFIHDDDSWAVQLHDGTFAMGVGQERVNAESFWKFASGTCGQPIFPIDAELPSDWIEWLRKGIRGAWLPFSRDWRGTSQEMKTVYKYLGYTEGPKQTWTHPEESSFLFAGGVLDAQTIVFRNMGFQSFPYNNQQSNMMNQIAQAWLDWVQGKAKLAPIDDQARWSTWGL